jgi:hypothetical protein
MRSRSTWYALQLDPSKRHEGKKLFELPFAWTKKRVAPHVRQRLATCGNDWQPACDAMAGRVWKPAPCGKVWKWWKKLGRVEKAGNGGKKLCTPFPAFHRCAEGVWHSWRTSGRLGDLAGTAGCVTKKSHTILPIFQPIRTHLMAGNFYRRRIPLPGWSFLQKVGRQIIWRATFFGGAGQCSAQTMAWRAGSEVDAGGCHGMPSTARDFTGARDRSLGRRASVRWSSAKRFGRNQDCVRAAA